MSDLYNNFSKIINDSAKTIKKVLNNIEKDEVKNTYTNNDIKHSEMANFEKSLNSMYVGCFRDNPSNPKMKYNLGIVGNQLDCINKGKESGVNFVALQNGNECYGGVTNDFMKDSVPRSFCNMNCTDQNTGKCGGNYFNQAYNVNKINTVENFESTQEKSSTEKGIEKTLKLPLYAQIIIFTLIIMVIFFFAYNGLTMV